MLSLQNIAHFYGHRLILKHISLDIPAGVTLLIGPNGAGKTTLLSIMGGLITPTSGTVHIPENCRIAMLGHNTFLYPELTGLENLLFWARLYGLGPDRAALEAAMERVGLKAFGQERAGTYSRGMAQRLSLARLLLIKPNVMLLDEPGTGLDTLSLQMLHTTIQDFANKGITIVWVTHSVEADWTFADTIVSLEGTRITHCLPAREYACMFLSSQPDLTDQHNLASLSGSSGPSRASALSSGTPVEPLATGTEGDEGVPPSPARLIEHTGHTGETHD